MDQGVLFESRFLDMYTGKKLLKDPVTAIIELIANAWDAGATRVDITWPNHANTQLVVSDNGEGMTEEQFYRRWRTLSYDRLSEQGSAVSVVGHSSIQRKTFGRNGIGRFAGFCFADSYRVATARNNIKVIYDVHKGMGPSPINLSKIGEEKSIDSGTSISIHPTITLVFTEERIKGEIGLRFLTDPQFKIYVNGDLVDFNDLPNDGVENFIVKVEGLTNTIRLVLIDAKKTDRTTKLHGVAWQVNGRLVGECSWQGSGHEALIDGRRIEAKRFTFIIFADVLNDPDIIKPDWSGFFQNNDLFVRVNSAVQNKIHEVLLTLSQERRQETFNIVMDSNADSINKMSLISRQRWEGFVQKAQEKCPAIAERDLIALSGVLANLELASSRYTLIHQLHNMEPNELEKLHEILKDWNIDTAKIVLDELKTRLKLVDELMTKTASDSTLELQELQPLFEQGLWIFGPEFETIEYTSNKGMTTVIQQLYGSTQSGSRNRPDFAVLVDSTVGCYSYPLYDDNFAEIGTDSLVIIELKRPGVPIGSEQKDQCWKYVKELQAKGLLTDATRTIRCYVLGKTISPGEGEKRTEGNKVEIQPMLFDTVLRRAQSRLFKLYDRIKLAPFLQDENIETWLEPQEQPKEEQGILRERES